MTSFEISLTQTLSVFTQSQNVVMTSKHFFLNNKIMSSIIMIPDELKTGLTTNKQTSNAEYTFTPTRTQKDLFRRLYKGNEDT